MARIVAINGRQWLAGMKWCSFEDTPDKDELRADADRLNADWYAVRVSETAVQAGFSEPIDGQKRPNKLFSLGAMLADSKEQPWLGIFKIAEGLWWYIAVRDCHAILPDGDVIGGEAEIHAARDRHSGFTDWNYVEGDIALLSELMDAIDERPTPVKSLASGGIPTGTIVASAAIVLVLAGGGYWWNHQRATEERERAVAMAEMRKQLTANKAPVLVPSPLLTTATPNAWLAACGSIVLDLPLSQLGWGLSDISCNSTAVVVNWTRQNGATVAHKPEGILSEEGNSVIETIPFPTLEPKGTDDATDLKSAQVIMRAWAQTVNFPITISTAAAPVLLPGASASSVGADGAPLRPPQSNVKFELPVSPFALDFSSIPGLRLLSIKTTISGWSVEGVLYGRR